MRYVGFILTLLLSAAFLIGGVMIGPGWFVPLAVFLPLSALGVWDLCQTKHSILRNYPLIGHFRYLFEEMRPELHQYFIESDLNGRPFDRDARSLIYERAKNVNQEKAFGTELQVYDDGYEWFLHSIAPRPQEELPFRVRVGGPGCRKPYEMALLNISAMSFGALSQNAILALNLGAKMGSFAHDTGEGGLSKYHLQHGGDLIWEIGSGYFGCRTRDGKFDLETFRDKANREEVKCVSIKLSQGAKPGLGGVMPASKVTAEIAEMRGVPAGEKCVSPPGHTAFGTPRELLEWLQQLRDATGGKPTGFKLCLGRPAEFLGICKAMLESNILPDFIIVDGGEGGTGAAPLEFEDHVGTPLTEGLHFVNNALIGCGLREPIRIGCSGKVTSAFEMAKRITQGADYCNVARGMMFALGCIQEQICHTNKCPVGVTTQDPKRVRALVVPTKAERVHSFQRNTTADFRQLIAALGLEKPHQLEPSMLMRRISPTQAKSYAELYHYLEPKELIEGQPPEYWDTLWKQASPDRFHPPAKT